MYGLTLMKNQKQIWIDPRRIKEWMDECGYGALRENTGAYARVRYAFKHLDQYP